MFFDTHAHYDDDYFDADREELMSKLLPESDISLVLNPACNMESAKAAIAYAEKYDYFYAAIGWHPSDVESFGVVDEQFLRDNLKHPKVVAVGEIGLDYYHTTDFVAEQKQAFRQQLEVAQELDVPVIIHDRDAHGDIMEILADYPKLRGVFHCYAGSVEMSKILIDRGWYLSFTGSITFKNARKAPDVIEATPIERIMLETDSPYLSPVPFRGKRNDSRNLPYIAQKIAEIKGMETCDVVRITNENGRRLFGINSK